MAQYFIVIHTLGECPDLSKLAVAVDIAINNAVRLDQSRDTFVFDSLDDLNEVAHEPDAFL